LAGQPFKIVREMTGSDLGPRVALVRLFLKKAQKAFQVGIEYLARNLVMQ
jgi:hypothetical protein